LSGNDVEGKILEIMKNYPGIFRRAEENHENSIMFVGVLSKVRYTHLRIEIWMSLIYTLFNGGDR
jgi:hypothetical protein